MTASVDMEPLIIQVREGINPGASEIMTDADVSRFIRARKHNVEKTVKMIDKWFEWWHTPLIGSEGLTPATILDEIEDPNEPLYQEFMPHLSAYEDKEGHPIYWEQTGLISGRLPKILEHLSVDELVVRHVRQQELTMRRLDYLSSKLGRPIEKQIVIFNMEKLNYSLDTRGMQTFRRTISIDQDFYPERLHCFYMINAPWFFSAIWAVVKAWIDPLTASKFKILGSDYMDTLKEHIDESVIPKEWGGLNEAMVWTWPYPEGHGGNPKELKEHKHLYKTSVGDGGKGFQGTVDNNPVGDEQVCESEKTENETKKEVSV